MNKFEKLMSCLTNLERFCTSFNNNLYKKCDNFHKNKKKNRRLVILINDEQSDRKIRNSNVRNSFFSSVKHC